MPESPEKESGSTLSFLGPALGTLGLVPARDTGRVSTPGSIRERPQPAYQAAAGGPLTVDRELYRRLSSESASRTLVKEFVIPIRSGRA